MPHHVVSTGSSSQEPFCKNRYIVSAIHCVIPSALSNEIEMHSPKAIEIDDNTASAKEDDLFTLTSSKESLCSTSLDKRDKLNSCLLQ